MRNGCLIDFIVLLVINEIEGLSKGNQNELTHSQKMDTIAQKEYEHNQMVGRAAKESLNFLRNKPSTVKYRMQF